LQFTTVDQTIAPLQQGLFNIDIKFISSFIYRLLRHCAPRNDGACSGLLRSARNDDVSLRSSLWWRQPIGLYSV